MNRVRLVVEGMSCRRCVRKVTRWLRDVPGVETVSVDEVSSSVCLTGTMTERDVLDVFAGIDYLPRIIDEHGH